MNKDLVKEKISWYKLLFTVLVTVTAGTMGWFVTNYNKALLIYVILDAIFVIGFIIGILVCRMRIKYYFRKLGEFKDV